MFPKEPLLSCVSQVCRSKRNSNSVSYAEETQLNAVAWKGCFNNTVVGELCCKCQILKKNLLKVTICLRSFSVSDRSYVPASQVWQMLRLNRLSGFFPNNILFEGEVGLPKEKNTLIYSTCKCHSKMENICFGARWSNLFGGGGE